MQGGDSHGRARRWLAALACTTTLGLGLLAAPNLVEWCATPNACAAGARERAERLSAAGETDRALAALMHAHTRYPDAATSAAIAAQLEARGESARALHFALDAHRRAPDDAELATLAARHLLDVDPRRAARIVEAVIAQDPDHVGARITHSQLTRAAGDRTRALADARALAGPRQTDPAAWHHLGRLIKMDIHDVLARGAVPVDGLFEEGIDALSRATALDPDNWVARLERVWVLSVWPGHQGEARDAAWRAYRATFATVPADVLERRARSEMLTLARRLGDRELILATERAEPGALLPRSGL